MNKVKALLVSLLCLCALSGPFELMSVRAAETGPRVLTGHMRNVDTVDFSPDGRLLASGSWDNTIKFWDVSTGRELRTITGHAELVGSVAFSPDGRILASGSADKTVKLWDVRSGKELRTLTGHTGWISKVVFSPDGRTVVAGSSDETAIIWEVRTGQMIGHLSGHSNWIGALAFSPDGSMLATAGGDTNIRIWEVCSNRLLRTLTGHTSTIKDVKFSPNGNMLASGSADHTVKLWDVSSGQLLRTMEGHTWSIESLAFTADGRTLASGSHDNTIKLWSVQTGKALRTLPGHTKGVSSVIFSPDGRTLASSGGDSSIKLWSLTQQACSDEVVSKPIGGQSSNGLAPDRPIRDKWAIIVGVSKFKDKTIPPLKYSAKDARDFYEYLVTKAHFKPDHVRLLTDELASRERIVSEIGDTFLPHVVGSNDLVVLYFSTHGSGAEHDVRRSNYLVAYDTPKALLYADGIEMQKLLDQLQERTHADRILIVLDACHSGGADCNAKVLGDDVRSVDINTLATGHGNIILTACQPNELSWESKRYPNGVFTKRLIEALSKNAGVSTAFSQIKEIVSDEVRQSFGQLQTPHIKADGWEGKELRLDLPATKPVSLSAEVRGNLAPDGKSFSIPRTATNNGSLH